MYACSKRCLSLSLAKQDPDEDATRGCQILISAKDPTDWTSGDPADLDIKITKVCGGASLVYKDACGRVCFHQCSSFSLSAYVKVGSEIQLCCITIVMSMQINGVTEPERGYSAIRFVPDSNDQHIIATKVIACGCIAHNDALLLLPSHLPLSSSLLCIFLTLKKQPLLLSTALLLLQTVETLDNAGDSSYITIFDVDGRVLLPETLISSNQKLEGLEIIGDA